MLRNRLITAAILIPLVVAGILLLPSDVFAVVLGLLLLLGAREMSQLAGFDSPAAQLLFMAALAAGMLAMFFVLAVQTQRPLQLAAALAWIVATVLLVARASPVTPVSGRRPGILLLGGVILLVAWCAVVTLHQRPEHGPALVLFLFVLIWTADSGAYFAGRAWGVRKLSPQVSPGKTWAGVGGAMAGALLCALLLDYLGLVTPGLPALLLLCLLVTAVSIGGDLFESLLKRQAQVKDSGSLLPGHGGALDRIDSLLAAAPVFAAGLGLLEGMA
jgi:phosphatidate cytidylyltransferase